MEALPVHRRVGVLDLLLLLQERMLMLLQERHLCTVDIRVALPEQLKKEHLRGCLVCTHRRRQLLRLLAEQLSEQIAVVLLAWLSAVG